MSSELPIKVFVANPTPFRLVTWSDEDEWSPRIEDINKNTYNSLKLHRLSKFFDIGLPCGSPVGVAFDGSFLIPGGGSIKTIEEALSHFNRAFASILLGGVYISSVDPEDVSLGTLYRIGYFRHNATLGGNAGFHSRIGDKSCGQGEAIELIDPPKIQASEIHSAFVSGSQALANLPRVSPSFLILSITDFARGKFRESLIHSWVCVEQILATLWDEKIRSANALKCSAEGRGNFLKGDKWSAAHKAEMLFQLGELDDKTYCFISQARRARNDFVHKGIEPKKAHAIASINALSNLIDHRINRFRLPLKKGALKMILRSNGSPRTTVGKAQHVDWDRVKYWKRVDPIPGEEGWSGEFETRKEITITPYTKDGPIGDEASVAF